MPNQSAPHNTWNQAPTAAVTPTFEHAEYGVPYCHFQRTDTGFVVSFKRMPTIVGVFLICLLLIDIFFVPLVFLFSSAATGWFLLVLSVALMILCANIGHTQIVVNREAVIIGSRTLNRQAFGSFGTAGKQLTYSYGLRTFSLDGLWGIDQAIEVAHALNMHLRNTPKAGDEQQLGPSVLRDVRSADY